MIVLGGILHGSTVNGFTIVRRDTAKEINNKLVRYLHMNHLANTKVS